MNGEVLESPIKRDDKGRWIEGNPPGPGRPKGKTLKEYARDYYALKTDEQKKAYIEYLESKLPGFAWRMAEGNPHQTQDITSAGKPTPLLNVILDNQSSSEDNQAQKEN